MTLKRNKNSNSYCGPAALALLTGHHVDVVTKMLRNVRQGRPVRGASSREMRTALAYLGKTVTFVPTRTAEQNLYGTNPTLTQALRTLQSRAADDRFLI